MTLAEAVRHRLLALMDEKHFSQYDFYVKGGIPKATASQILSGSRSGRVALKTLYEMIAAMGVSLSDFFTDPIFDELSD